MMELTTSRRRIRIHFSGLVLLLQVLAHARALPTDFTTPDRLRTDYDRLQRIQRGGGHDSTVVPADPAGFPDAWKGLWFQSSIADPIVVNSTAMDGKGVIVQAKPEHLVTKYLLYDSDLQCHRCLAISDPHKNALQYKESDCKPTDDEPNPTLDSLCDEIGGRNPLFSMFRLNAAPEKCPFSGRFAFTYTQNLRACSNPVSSAESCVKGTELMLQYKSCPDMTEERKMRLECQASWSKGDGQWYLVGRMFHHKATSNEETYRCFIYEEIATGKFKVSQSADASCMGLYSATVDMALTMEMTQLHDPPPTCVFPTWLTHVRQWHDMASTMRFVFGPPETSLRQYSLNATSDKELLLDATCLRKEWPETASESHFRAVAFVVQGCSSGYICMNWRRRSDQVVQLQQGRFSSSAGLACSEDYWNNQTDWTTLVSSDPAAVQCPFPGQYLVPTPDSSTASKCGDITKVTIGCHGATAIQFTPHPDAAGCAAQLEEALPMHFTCHGHWMDNKVGYFIASETNKQTKHCFVYQEEKGVLRLSSIPNRCPISLDRHEQFNVTHFQECDRRSSNGVRLQSWWFFPILLIALAFRR